MRNGAHLIAATLVATSLMGASSVMAGNALPKWTHIAISHGERGSMSVNYRTDTLGTVASVSAKFVGPYEGPAPYQTIASLAATGNASAIARTGIGFSGNATGFSYPLTLQLVGAKGALGVVNVDAKVRAKGAESEDGEDADGSGTVSAEIIALDDQDGDGDPDAYRVVVVAGGDFGRQVSKVAITFNKAFKGPAPHALSLTVPFKVFNQEFASANLYFDGNPIGFSYTVALTPLGPDGKEQAPAVSYGVKVKRDRTTPTIGAVAIRTAPAQEACEGGLEEEGGNQVICSTQELESFAARLANLSELAGLYNLDADAAEAAMAYIGGTEPWEWTGSGDIFRKLVGSSTLASAKALILEDTLRDALLGLSAAEAVELGQLTSEQYPDAVTASAFELGQELGGGFFLGLESAVPFGGGKEIYPNQVVVDGFAFDPTEIKERLASSSVSERPTHPIGLRLGISKGWESARADWNGLDSTPWEQIASHALIQDANVAVAFSFPEDAANAERAALIKGYEEQLADAKSQLAARKGGGGWSNDPIYLKHRYQAQSGNMLGLPGIIDVLNGGDGALFVSLSKGMTSFVKGSDPVGDPNVSMMALRRGKNPGHAGFWTTYDTAAADATVSWLLGTPAITPDEAKIAADAGAKAAVAAAAEVQAIVREVAGAKAAAGLLGEDPNRRRRLRPTGFVVIIE